MKRYISQTHSCRRHRCLILCTMSSVNKNDKLKEVLGLLLLPDYSIASTTCLDILLSHIENKISSRGCTGGDVDKSILQKWVSKAMDTWTVEKKPYQAVIIFTIKLVRILGRDEVDFLYWYHKDILNKLCTVFALKDSHVHSSVKMAYTKMLLEFVNHTSGRQWIIETEAWIEQAKSCHSNRMLYVTRESQKFICKLLMFESGNTVFCGRVISVAAEPFIRNNFGLQPQQKLEENEAFLSAIDVLTAIMENTLFLSIDNAIPRLLDSVTNLESRIMGLFESCTSIKLHSHIMKLVYLLLFMRLKDGIDGSNGVVDPKAWEVFGVTLQFIDSVLLAKKHILGMANGGKLLLTYWKKVNRLCDIKMPSNYQIENHGVVLLMGLLDVFVCVPEIPEDEFEIFLYKFFSVTSTYTQRFCYMLRDTLLREELPKELMAKTSIQIILDTLDVMDREGVAILFQLMSHLLKQYASAGNNEASCRYNFTTSKYGNEVEYHKVPRLKVILNGDPIVKFPELLSAVLHALATILRKYKFKWQECLETITILPSVQAILNHPNAGLKVCIQALSLCRMGIENFMAPNLVLLMKLDRQTDEMGLVLCKRLHDAEWQVRESVLQVINTIARIAEDKYPAFQDLLLANRFPELIVDIAATDEVGYVRATALKCLSNFVRLHKIWTDKLYHLDLPNVAVNLITNEMEAIVRREAVILVKELFVYRKCLESTLDKITNVMSATAILDLNWEVRVKALDFWSQFIKSRLSDQGMLDGTFPTYTFSKEHRRIVSLDEDEIKKRIIKVLDELANRNCLSVLLATLDNDSDFQVCKASGEIVKMLKQIFVSYKIRPSCNTENDIPLVASDRNLNSKILSLGKTQDRLCIRNETREIDHQPTIPAKIIDIVDSDEENPLGSLYKRTLNMSINAQPSKSKNIKYVSNVTRSQFIRMVFNYNIDAYLEEKNPWLKTHAKSFRSIINDIIVAHQRNKVNHMEYC
ncbi:uncharacterized protein LOC124186183 isoform X1 [Neodiprion fabricii]|uniref:uncharacterized protein LOC124186183 isoform X1 n=2 Tax=Neodiprion fabricii TaxID=2872261 RepID=UPI001ED8C7B3|nr:uncharacterized protein LOC124186183 isoform X1 [Neodiprion fabricii]XP_046433609.1 uncharacterized protein LOC124186183 isoform X1 [Neodiprion fabricii]